MPLPPNLDLVDITILRVLNARGEMPARAIQEAVFFSRSQVLKRLRLLEQQGLVIKRNGVPGRTSFFRLSGNVLPEDLGETEQERLARLMRSRNLISQEIRLVIDRLTEVRRLLDEERMF